MLSSAESAFGGGEGCGGSSYLHDVISTDTTNQMGSTNEDPIVISYDESMTSDESMPSDSMSTDSMSTMSKSSYSSASDEDASNFLIRGPKIEGDLPFDEYYVYGNDMSLRDDHVDFLKNWAFEAEEPDMRYYLYKMTKSSLNSNKCKLIFGVDYTRTYLQPLLAEPIDVSVECLDKKKKSNVRMKMALSRNNAIMTTQWFNAATKYNFKEFDIVLFNFYVRHALLVNLGHSFFLE